MKLISMTSFVLEQNKILETYVNHLRKPLFERCVNYANFLKQPLNLGMFIPCDEFGNVLEEPKKEYFEVRVNAKCSDWDYLFNNEDKVIGYYDSKLFNNALKIYKKSKEKVLFENAVLFETKPYFNTKRILISINNNHTFRIYNQFNYRDGSIEKQYFPNNENSTIEDLIQYNLQLTENAVKQIGL